VLSIFDTLLNIVGKKAEQSQVNQLKLSNTSTYSDLIALLLLKYKVLYSSSKERELKK
jgi:hypothetical protein